MRRLAVLTDMDDTLLNVKKEVPIDTLITIYNSIMQGVRFHTVSSKTFTHQASIFQELNNSLSLDEHVNLDEKFIGISQAFIFENGSGLAFEEGYFDLDQLKIQKGNIRYIEYGGKNYVIVQYGIPSVELTGALLDIRSKLNIQFDLITKMKDEELSSYTHNPIEMVSHCKKRDFSEAIKKKGLSPKQQQSIIEEIYQLGYGVKETDRWITVTSPEVDKSKTVKVLLNMYEVTGKGVVAVIYGDDKNDEGMLTMQDNRIKAQYLVQQPDGRYIEMSGKIKQIEGIGPIALTKQIPIDVEKYHNK